MYNSAPIRHQNAHTEINFTKQVLSSLPTPNKNKRLYRRDIREKGLTLCKTHKGTITFFLRKRIDGKDDRVIIGRYPEISIENARKKALLLKANITDGINPNKEKTRLGNEILFKDLYKKYIEDYAMLHKRSWKEDVRYEKYLCNFMSIKLSRINRLDIQNFHNNTAKNKGIYTANRLLSLISVIFNKAIEWGWEGSNPAQGIKKFREKSRSRFLHADELSRFFQSLEQEENNLIKDFIYVSIFTGARKSNILSMIWQDINIDSQVWKIPESKNGEELSVYLHKEVIKILKRRKKENYILFGESKFVFPGNGVTGHLVEPKRGWQKIVTRAQIENLRLHDLRRTYGSWQAALGSSLYVIGKSLGHKSTQVTEIYSRINLDPIKHSVDMAIDKMMEIKDKPLI